MTPAQAIEILDKAVQTMKLTRPEHALLIEALAALKPKEEAKG